MGVFLKQREGAKNKDRIGEPHSESGRERRTQSWAVADAGRSSNVSALTFDVWAATSQALSLLRSEIGCCKSAEREAKNLRTGINKFDFKLAIDNRSGLPDQLVQTLCSHCADALFVNVESVSGARRLSVDQDAKLNGRSWFRGTHDKMKIAGMKTVHQAPVRLVQFGCVALYRPIAGQRPIIPAESRRHCINMRFVTGCAARRRKALGPFISDVVFRRLEACPIGGHFKPPRFY